MRRGQRGEDRAILQALQAPALVPFLVVAGDLGIAAAVEVCDTRELTGRLLAIFAAHGWTLDHLPSSEDALNVVLGARLAKLMERSALKKRKGGKPVSLQAHCKGLCSFDEARHALKIMERFGCLIAPVHHSLGA